MLTVSFVLQRTLTSSGDSPSAMKRIDSKPLLWLAIASIGFAIAIGAKVNAVQAGTLVDTALFVGTAIFVVALVAFWRSRLDNIRSD